MHADRFDSLSRALAITTRRGALRRLASGALGLLSSERARATHTGCLHHGSRCKQHIQCCSGKCSHKHRCKCPRGTTKCGEIACCRNADEQCCGDTCGPATLTPEGGACVDSGQCCPGSTCTTESAATARVCCASGKSCSGKCCSAATDVCDSDNLACCRPEKLCRFTCCAEGELCTAENVCCASGKSCFGNCCRRADAICTSGDLECCRPENVCVASCCSRPDEFCDGLNCVPIVNG